MSNNLLSWGDNYHKMKCFLKILYIYALNLFSVNKSPDVTRAEVGEEIECQQRYKTKRCKNKKTIE